MNDRVNFPPYENKQEEQNKNLNSNNFDTTGQNIINYQSGLNTNQNERLIQGQNNQMQNGFLQFNNQSQPNSPRNNFYLQQNPSNNFLTQNLRNDFQKNNPLFNMQQLNGNNFDRQNINNFSQQNSMNSFSQQRFMNNSSQQNPINNFSQQNYLNNLSPNNFPQQATANNFQPNINGFLQKNSPSSTVQNFSAQKSPSNNFAHYSKSEIEQKYFNHGAKLKNCFDDLIATKKKFEKILANRELVDNEIQENNMNDTKLNIFMDKCGKYIRPRKNGSGKFSIEDYVNFNIPVIPVKRDSKGRIDSNYLQTPKMSNTNETPLMDQRRIIQNDIKKEENLLTPLNNIEKSNNEFNNLQMSTPIINQFRNNQAIPNNFSQTPQQPTGRLGNPILQVQVADVLKEFDAKQAELSTKIFQKPMNNDLSGLAPQNVVLANISGRERESSPSDYIPKRRGRKPMKIDGEKIKQYKENNYDSNIIKEKIYSIPENNESRILLQSLLPHSFSKDKLNKNGINLIDSIGIELDAFLHEIIENSCLLAGSKKDKKLTKNDVKYIFENKKIVKEKRKPNENYQKILQEISEVEFEKI